MKSPDDYFITAIKESVKVLEAQEQFTNQESFKMPDRIIRLRRSLIVLSSAIIFSYCSSISLSNSSKITVWGMEITGLKELNLFILASIVLVYHMVFYSYQLYAFRKKGKAFSQTQNKKIELMEMIPDATFKVINKQSRQEELNLYFMDKGHKKAIEKSNTLQMFQFRFFDIIIPLGLGFSSLGFLSCLIYKSWCA